MSIIIPGMKMPRFGECIVITSDGVASKYLDGDVAIYYAARPDKEAAAVELPPHGRLIDVDALRRAMYHEAFETDSPMQKWDSGCWIRYKLFERVEEAAPTIVPADPEKEE